MAGATYGHAVQAASLWLDPSHRYEDRENDLGSPLRYCADERSLWHSVDAADNYRHPEQWRLCGYGQRSDFPCGRDGYPYPPDRPADCKPPMKSEGRRVGKRG